MIDLKKTSRLFWMLQASGWLLFLILSLIAVGTRGALNSSQTERYTTGMATGFLVTLALRYVYRKLRARDLPIVGLSLLILLSCLLGVNILVWLWKVFLAPFQGWKALWERFSLPLYLYRLMWWFVPVLAWSALYFGFHFWKGWTARRERTERAQALVQAAQLQMLRYRMNPHFLFNALNSIRALIAEDRTTAKRVVTELSEFLRYSLVSRDTQTVSFREELESVRHFFNIQKVRYEKKLDISFHIDPEVEDLPIASFVLHPLVENAVRYGMRTSALPLRIQVRAEPLPGGLQVEVVNSGAWVAPLGQPEGAVLPKGLDYVRRRLEEAYPGKHRFEVGEKDQAVHARLVIGKDASGR